MWKAPKRVHRAKAIREKCLDCSGDSPLEVTLCPVCNCPLWYYRTGSSQNKDYEERVGRALGRNTQVESDILELWRTNGMVKEEVEKYRRLSTLFREKTSKKKETPPEKHTMEKQI